MLSLSPAKLLVILVIALIVLGPEKLPQVARQIGAAWHDLRAWRSRIEAEVRATFPNLPPTHEVAQAVRSPLAFLDRLADEHEKAVSEESQDSSTEPGTEHAGPAPPDRGVVEMGPTGNGSSAGGSAPDNGVVPANGTVPANGAVAHNGSVGHNGSEATERAGTPVPGV